MSDSFLTSSEFSQILWCQYMRFGDLGKFSQYNQNSDDVLWDLMVRLRLSIEFSSEISVIMGFPKHLVIGSKFFALSKDGNSIVITKRS